MRKNFNIKKKMYLLILYFVFFCTFCKLSSKHTIGSFEGIRQRMSDAGSFFLQTKFLFTLSDFYENWHSDYLGYGQHIYSSWLSL